MSDSTMKQSIKVRDAISRMSYYDPPLENRNPEEHLLMDFNESPLPPHPAAVKKIAEFLSKRVHSYPVYGDFLEKLADYAGVNAENLLLTNGSDQAIDVILRSLLESGDELTMVQPGFAMFRQIAGTLGCSVVGPQFPADFQFPLAELKASVNEKTRLIVVINPNNPTGTAVSREQIEDLLKTFPDIPVLIDEAYFEFTGKSSVPLLVSYPNLIIIRTFSKALALPSLRLGYVIAAADYIVQLQKIRGPYDVNLVAVLAAREQLLHPEHWQSVVRHLMEESKPALEKYFDEQQVKYYASAANFMLVEPENVAEATAYLKEYKILVRPMSSPIAHTFRMSLRMLPDMLRFMEVYSSYLKT
ncbi:MAG: histidinol-phosphate aminotransferase family protein [SAR324 cluster bacterium]|nr:histidinol-phosphate aminotransferase family protein [SAR324 cluster bacterium]MBL7035578.1 histidinol-phosphate aminotransferase family protein [SAR324 cluster bacterium]